MSSTRPIHKPLSPRGRRRAAGLTLVEMMVTLTIIAITSAVGVGSFLLLNRYATSARNISSAKALCQERIEQALNMPFHPPQVCPVAVGPTTSYSLLGTSSNWTSAPPPYVYGSPANFQGSSVVTTSNEDVSVYVQQDGATANVPGKRVTTVYCTDTTLDTAQFTVTVTYTYRNTQKSYSMYLLRSRD